MLLKEAPPTDVMQAGSAWKPAYDSGHEPPKTTTTLPCETGPQDGGFLDLPGRHVYSLPHVIRWRRRMFGIGIPELLIILVIILVIFGANKLPEIGAGMGKAIKNFKKATNEPEEIDVTPKKDDTPEEKK